MITEETHHKTENTSAILAQINQMLPYIAEETTIKDKDTIITVIKRKDNLDEPKIGKLELKVILPETEARKVEDVTEELYLENKPRNINPAYNLEHLTAELPNVMFRKPLEGSDYVDRFTREIKKDWFINYSTVRENLRNITPLRDIMGYLESQGQVNPIKKIK